MDRPPRHRVIQRPIIRDRIAPRGEKPHQGMFISKAGNVSLLDSATRDETEEQRNQLLDPSGCLVKVYIRIQTIAGEQEILSRISRLVSEAETVLVDRVSTVCVR